jgi:tRNA pseudouridine55 synthase
MQVDGFLNLCKPLGWTSHDVVGFVRRRIGQRRVGHAGTLDPAASGVLPLCLGRATRLADRVAAGSKLYAADLRLGVTTDAGDAEGRLLAEQSADAVRLSAIVAALASQVGQIAQRPPTYSALKVQGVPAYERARRGETVALAAREVTVYGLAVVDWQPPRVTVLVHCSKGTYVRSLARDVGESLDCGGHLDALARLAVGQFTLADAISVEAFDRAVADGCWRDLVLPPDSALAELPALLLSDTRRANFAHGRPWPDSAQPPEARAFAADGSFLGLARAESAGTRWQPALSFVYDPDVTDDG